MECLWNHPCGSRRGIRGQSAGGSQDINVPRLWFKHFPSGTSLQLGRVRRKLFQHVPHMFHPETETTNCSQISWTDMFHMCSNHFQPIEPNLSSYVTATLPLLMCLTSTQLKLPAPFQKASEVFETLGLPFDPN